MNDTALREALHDVASAGVGPDVDARVARLASEAREGQGRSAGRGPRRGWTFGALGVAAVAVAVLLVVGLAAMTRSPVVVPASGPGSLPDQIFPTREHILTLEQAPIGRVSMVYATAIRSGDADAAWIAVGADSDEYRWVAAVEQGSFEYPTAQPTVVELSSDGRFVAVGYSGDDGARFRVTVIDASTGGIEDVQLGYTYAQLGGEIEGLSWSPSGRRLVVEAAVVVKRLSDTARRWQQRMFFVDGLTEGAGEVRTSTVQGVRAEGGDQLVGWSGERPVVLSTAREETRGDLVVVGGSVIEQVGRVDRVPMRPSVYSLSPDGSLLAGLSDPTPGASGDGRPWHLGVFDTESGDLVWENKDVPEDLSALVGWSDLVTPVLFIATPGEGRDNPPDNKVAEYLEGTNESVRVVDLENDDADYWVQDVALAAEILASGQVRSAQPPDQPWYDLRTLGPATAEWIVGHTMLVVLIVVALVGTIVVVARRRRVV